MKSWTIDDAQLHFTDVLQSCFKEPQVVCDRDKAIGVVVNMAFFQELMNAKEHSYRPSIGELLDELENITAQEPIDLDIPERQDRSHSFFEEADEILV